MSTERLTRIDCDRCPATITVADGDRRDGWGHLHATPAGDGAALPSQDLCPDCYRSLFAWRNDATADPAPTPPPAPRKSEVSKGKREAAYETADAALAEAVTALVTTIRQEPTMILNDALVATDMLATKPIATQLVDQLIRDFGLLRRGR